MKNEPTFGDRPAHKGYSGKARIYHRGGWGVVLPTPPTLDEINIAKALVEEVKK